MTWMVGDDIETDVVGARGVGMHAVLVRTGKFRPDSVESSRVQPDVVYFRDGLGQIRKVRAGTTSAMDVFRMSTASAASDRIAFSAKITVRRDEELNEMFEERDGEAVVSYVGTTP